MSDPEPGMNRRTLRNIIIASVLAWALIFAVAWLAWVVTRALA